MRLGLRAEGPIDQVALWLNLAPSPVAETLFGMTMSRVLMAGIRLGLFAALAGGPIDAAALADRCGLRPDGTRHLLDCLAALGHVRRQGARYQLSARGRRWLDPASSTYIGTFLEFNYAQWAWWSRLEEVISAGQSFEIHDFAPDDPRWRLYITAMFELSRLAAPEVARKIRLPSGATRLLDVAGGHGWFSATLVRRHPGLTSTVLELPGSARIGREIIANAGLSDRVLHLEGDLTREIPPGPFDGILYFQTFRHFSLEQNLELLRRLHDVLVPGGVLAVMDYVAQPDDRQPDMEAFVGLNYYLTTGGALSTAADMQACIRSAGFTDVRSGTVLRLPGQALCLAKKAR